MYYIIASAAAILAALGFMALGMRIANENNKRAWEKYYEGMGKKPAQYAQSADVVSFQPAQRKAR